MHLINALNLDDVHCQRCVDAIILFPIKCTTTLKTILTTSYHISIKMFPKSLISELSRAIASVYYTR